MNQGIELIKNRRSIRHYKEELPERSIIEQIVDAGTYAATAMNRQSPIIVAVTDRALRDRLSAMNARILEEMGRGGGGDPFYGAPVVLIVLADRSIPSCVQDGSLVMGNLMLAASALGLGSCWINRAREAFDTDEGKQILASLGISGDYIGVGHCILGYPDGEAPQAKPRKENYVYWAE